MEHVSILRLAALDDPCDSVTTMIESVPVQNQFQHTNSTEKHRAHALLLLSSWSQHYKQVLLLEHAQRQPLGISIWHIQCAVSSFSLIPTHELEKMDYTK
jgi:hypothetical protein